MKFCKDEECRRVACCSFCIHYEESIKPSERICKLDGEMREPYEVCEEFECFQANSYFSTWKM